MYYCFFHLLIFIFCYLSVVLFYIVSTLCLFSHLYLALVIKLGKLKLTDNSNSSCSWDMLPSIFLVVSSNSGKMFYKFYLLIQVTILTSIKHDM